MIEVKNVTKKYGTFTAVDDINFEVNDHEIVGFLGPNGAGKSTTMNMITGYIEPSKGKIIINGYDMSKSPIRAKKQIGYMPENVPLYPELTVKEFVTYMAELKRVKRKDRKAQVEKILEETGLLNVQNKLIKNISRGYKQRVSLAGALIGNPEILILDEPTVGLDPKQITEIRELIKNLGKNHTVILSSHILSEVSQICEKVIIINNGKILAVDTPQNLEERTKNDNSILVTVEDKNGKMKGIEQKLEGVTSIKQIKDNQDGTIQYLISAKKDVDIRKNVFEILPKENITIFELKKSENTLEDAFLKIINNKEDEIKKEEEKLVKQKIKREKELEKMDKKERKQAIKEDRKKEKEAKKEEFNKEWEKERAIEKEEKERRKKEKEQKKEKKVNKSKTSKSEDNSKTEVTENKDENKINKSAENNKNKTTKNKTTKNKTENNRESTLNKNNNNNQKESNKTKTNKETKKSNKKGGNK